MTGTLVYEQTFWRLDLVGRRDPQHPPAGVSRSRIVASAALSIRWLLSTGCGCLDLSSNTKAEPAAKVSVNDRSRDKNGTIVGFQQSGQGFVTLAVYAAM